ncbi:MAG: hypothetical protein R3C19_13520 [Planctomycetaceae bacterium]
MKQSCLILLSMAIIACTYRSADAISPFKKEFETKYVKSSDSDDFKAEFKKGSCNVCHVKGKKKDWLNAYGLQLAKRIPGEAKERLDVAKASGEDALKAENEALLEEVKKAFKEVESVKSPGGETFGAMFKDNRIPDAEGARSLYDPEDEAKEESEESDTQ